MLLRYRRTLWIPVEITEYEGKESKVGHESCALLELLMRDADILSAQPSGTFLIFSFCPSL